MFIDVPEGKHPVIYVWGEMVPKIGIPAAMFSQAVYEHGSLSLHEFEAARLTIAEVNGCVFCQDWRTERDGRTVDADWFEAVEHWRTSDRLDDRSRLAAEYAERYLVDHHSIDDEFWVRMRAVYTDNEIVELSMCIGSWLAFGRLNRVLGLDVACQLPAH